MALQNDHEFTPVEVSRAVFPTAFRGYDQEAVRRYLTRLAESLEHQLDLQGLEALEAHAPTQDRIEELEDEAAGLKERILALEAEVEAKDGEIDEVRSSVAAADGPPEIDEQQAIAWLGKETARVLESARSAAADIVNKAETEAAASRSEAERVLETARAESADLVAERTAEAEERAAVVTAEAEERAAVVTAEAEERAAVVTAEAEERAATLELESQEQAEQLASEAERLRSEAEDEGARLRAEAEAEREALLAHAQAESSSIVVSAEEYRKELLTGLVSRRRAEIEGVKQLDDARQALTQALLQAQGQLEEVVTDLELAHGDSAAPGDGLLSSFGELDIDDDVDVEVQHLVEELNSSLPPAPDTLEELPEPAVAGEPAVGESDSIAKPKAASKSQSTVSAKPKAASKAQPKAASKSQPKVTAKPKTASKAQPKAASKSQAKTASKSQPKAASKSQSTVSAKPKAASGEQAQAGTKSDPAASQSKPKRGSTASSPSEPQAESAGTADEPTEELPAIFLDKPEQPAGSETPVAEGVLSSLVEGFSTIEVADIDRLTETGSEGGGGSMAFEMAESMSFDTLVKIPEDPAEVVTSIAARVGGAQPDGRRGDLDIDDPKVDRLPPWFAARDATISRGGPNFRRHLRRALNDDQSDVLDRLRNGRGAIRLDELPTVDEQLERFEEPVRRSIAEVVKAGARSGGIEDVAAPVLDNLVSQIAAHLVDSVRIPAMVAIAEADHGDRELILEPIRAQYRDVRNLNLPDLADDVLHEAFAIGLYEAIVAGGAVRWAVDPRTDPDPVCEINRDRADLTKGEAFPSGHLRPLALSGCRCLVVAGE